MFDIFQEVAQRLEAQSYENKQIHKVAQLKRFRFKGADVKVLVLTGGAGNTASLKPTDRQRSDFVFLMSVTSYKLHLKVSDV